MAFCGIENAWIGFLAIFPGPDWKNWIRQVLNILRIGLFQVVYLTRIPASAAVNTAVELAKTLKKPWLAKFVNAVLRAAVREYPELIPSG